MYRDRLTLDHVLAYSGAELVESHGPEVLDQLADLVAAAVWKGDDEQVALIDTRLREVELALTGQG